MLDEGRSIVIDESRRPYLIHLRMLQEWLLCGRREARPSDTVPVETTFGQSPAPGGLETYSRGAHTHGTPTIPGDVVVGAAGRATVVALQNASVVKSSPLADGNVLTVEGGTWTAKPLPAPPALAGDVTGPFNGTVVEKLRGVAVEMPAAPAEPGAGTVLTFRDHRWHPEALPAPPAPTLNGDVTGASNATVVE